MRRVIVLGVIALVVTVASGAGMAAIGDVKGRTCADIVDGGAFYNGATLVVTADIFLDAASCRNIRYSIVVIDEESGNIYTGTTVGDGEALADGTDVVNPSVGVPSNEPGQEQVCFFLTTSGSNGRIIDRAPDDGCKPLTEGGTGGGGGMN
jgi:hypothetical protein